MDTNSTEYPDYSDNPITENKEQAPAARSRKELGNILLSAINLHFCQKHRLTSTINFSTLATKSGLSLDEVKSVIHYLVDNDLCRYQGEQLTELNDIAFTVFEVKSVKHRSYALTSSIKYAA